MKRQPHNVLVFPFRQSPQGTLFLLLRRADDGVWQAVCGGVEEGESLSDAARREMHEEAGIAEAPLFSLSMVGGARRSNFGADAYWPPHIYIVEKHFFGADFEGHESAVSLSSEHTELEWFTFDQAHERIAYSDERTALWELNQRLMKSDLVRI